MTRRTVSVLMLWAMLLLLLPGAAAAATQFTDVENHWAEDYILSFASKGYIEGYPDGTFRPEQPISRAEFTCILLNSLGITPSGSTAAAFGDTASHWAHAQIDEAAARGILVVSEYPNGLKPDGSILRSEAAAMIIRALGKSPNSSQSSFTDSSQIAKSMYNGYIQAAAVAGYIKGYPDGTFRPFSVVKRAEACKLLSGLSDGSTTPGITATTGGLTGLVVQGNRYSLTSATIYLRRDQANIPIYSIGTGSGMVSINNTFPFALNGTSNNPDLVINNARYINCQLSVSGSDLVAVPASTKADSYTYNSYKYGADYVELYIGSKDTDYYLSDAELMDSYNVKIANTSYNINSTQIAIALGQDFFAIKAINYGSDGISFNLKAIPPVVVSNLDLSNFSAIFVNSNSLDLDSIDSLQFIVGGELYGLSGLTIDASGGFTVNNKNYAPDQVTVLINNGFYELESIDSLNSKFVLYCTPSEVVDWAVVDGKYRDASTVQVIRGTDSYSLNNILVVRRNVIRIGSSQISIVSGLATCRMDGVLYGIEEIDYDTDTNMVVLETTEVSGTSGYLSGQPLKYVFYLNNFVYQDAAASTATIYAGGGWRTLSGITFTDQAHFTYNSISYNLIGARVKIDGSEYEVTDSAWRVSSQIMDIYLQAV
jgi:hypothetical protein